MAVSENESTKKKCKKKATKTDIYVYKQICVLNNKRIYKDINVCVCKFRVSVNVRVCVCV